MSLVITHFNNGGDMQIIIIVFSSILLLALIFLLVTYKKIRKEFYLQKEEYKLHKERFKDVINIDDEIDKQKNQLSILQNEYLSKKEAYKNKFSTLDNEYSKSKNIFDELIKGINLLEEKTEIHSYGLYEPHYSFVSSKEYQDNLDQLYEQQKECIKNDNAVICSTEWTVGGSKAEGRRMTKQYSKLMLRAFNGDCDACISKVKWNNAKTMEERMKKSFDNINKLGVSHNIYITNTYFDLRLKELWLTYELQEKLYQEKEEQRRIKEQIREEEKVQREVEQAKKEAEEEERRYSIALEKARKELEKASEKEFKALSEKMIELEEKLKAAQEMKERALSRAQITKSGNVYIISNIGSFGENVFKIGMTRRLEPLDRVRELGDASVPFSFDVHAMIYSDDAPNLEYKLHQHFDNHRVNLINNRKEFFNVSLEEIKKFAQDNNINVMFTDFAEAREYHESKAKKENFENIKPELVEEIYPDKLFDEAYLEL